MNGRVLLASGHEKGAAALLRSDASRSGDRLVLLSNRPVDAQGAKDGCIGIAGGEVVRGG